MQPEQGWGPGYGPWQGIALTAEHFPLAWQFAFVKPRVWVNGHPITWAGWGRTVVPLHPGRYHVHVYTPYLLPPRVGPADYAVDVPPGRVVDLHYRAPLWAFSRGSLGPPPQAYNGVGVVAGTAVAAAVVVVVAMAVLLLLAA